MSDKTVADELMALYRNAVELHVALARWPYRKDGGKNCAEADAALEQAIRRAVDLGEPVARVVNAPHMHMVGPEDGGYYDIHHVTDIRLPDGTPLYARRQDQ